MEVQLIMKNGENIFFVTLQGEEEEVDEAMDTLVKDFDLIQTHVRPKLVNGKVYKQLPRMDR